MSKLRLIFVKEHQASYISHLDVMRTFQRVFPRAGLSLRHSNGFHPHPVLSIVLPLPVGQSSQCELLDFETMEDSDGAGVAAMLNTGLPAGLRVLRAYESAVKVKHLTYLQSEVTLEYDAGVPQGAEAAIAALFAQPEIPVEKRSKKGGMVDVDLRPLLRSLEIRKASAQELTLDVLASAQNPGMNPQLLVAAVTRHLPELRPDFARIRRMEIFDEQMEVFR